MMTTTLRLTGLAGLLALTACATPTPPVYDTGDYFDAAAQAARLNALPAAPSADLPVSGSATYDGFMSGRLTGDADGRVVGAMGMNIGFGGATDAISGRVSDITLLGSTDLDDQTLGGFLTIDGSRAGSNVIGAAGGRLTAVDGTGIAGGYDMNLPFNGALRSDVTGADSVSGRVTGGGVGTGWASGEVVTLQDGRFYGQR